MVNQVSNKYRKVAEEFANKVVAELGDDAGALGAALRAAGLK